MALKELLETDSEISSLNESIQKIKARSISRAVNLMSVVLERKKQIAVDGGYAVKTIAKMSEEGELRFRKTNNHAVIRYKAPGKEQTYMRCGFCKLYIRDDAISEEKFGEREIHSRERGVHEMGMNYNCPICDTSMGKKVNFSKAVD